MMSTPTLSIVIPAYNEEKTLATLVEKVMEVQLPVGFEKEVIIVNDCSKDATAQVIHLLQQKYPYIKTLNNEKNLGKSRTVTKGILATSGEFVVVQDADLEYDPSELALMLERITLGNLDVVYGNRFGKKNKVIYWANYIGNKGLSFISNVFTFPRIKVWIPDMEVCYKMVRGEVIRDIARTFTATSNFGFEPEVTAKLSRYKKDGKRLAFAVVPISYYPRSVAEGKKMKAVEDGLKALREILHYNLRKE